MPVPVPVSGKPNISHLVVIIYTSPSAIHSNLNPFGNLLGNAVEIDGKNTYCFLVDPRYGSGQVCSYIEELGGTVYNRPPESPPIYE
jgi:hypothetical protein